MDTQKLDIPILWPNYFEDCEQCVERLRAALKAMRGVSRVSIDTENRTVQISYDKSVLTFESIKDQARAIGVQLAERFRHQRVRLLGLDCPDCAAKLESAVRRLPGVAWASVNYAGSELAVEFEPQVTSLEKITRRVHESGYDVEEAEATPERLRARRLRRHLRMALTAISGALLIAGIASKQMAGQSPLSSVLLVLAAMTGGVFAARAAAYSIKGRSLDMNVLMTTAAIGALCLREYAEAAAVMFLFSLGSTLESYAVEKTRRSIEHLIDEVPSSATVNRSGVWVSVPVDHIEIGEIVMVRPGEKIAVDGTVVAGESSVSEAAITGESAPKPKSAGDRVFAGSTNGTGSLDLRTTSRSEDNTIARIVHLVEEAQAQKAPSQRFSEAFGRVYTPCVIGLAVLTVVVGPTVADGSVRGWVTRALTLLVVSCPCALVISTPVAVVAAIGSAARSGVLIKGGAHLEMLGQVTVLAIDKTGTLTTGRPQVKQVLPLASNTAADVICIAASVEYRSEHPLANPIVAKARDMGIELKHAAFFEAMPGKGAKAVLDDGLFYVGSRTLMEELGVVIPDTSLLDCQQSSGCTPVWVADEKSALGVVALADTVRKSARSTVSRLRQAGVRRLVLLTGDSAGAGESVGREVGLDEVFSGLLPQAKVKEIGRLRKDGARVAMVGDGINDAPALATADVGIAMGGAGSETAVEVADVVLMADNLIMLPYAFDLSRSARRIIRQNVFFALGVVLVLVAGAMSDKVGLSAGVLGHEGSALLVIGNSMRLFRRRLTHS